MYFNHRNNPRMYGSGCSIFGCFLGFFVLMFLIQGSFYLLFEYFWLFILLGIIIWVFRKFTHNQNKRDSDRTSSSKKSDWNRDFENRKTTSYHNIERDFEEVDEDEEDEFKDF